MAGISSKAAGKTQNKNKFNGIEQNSDFDLNMYDAFYRNLDPQIGRFWQVDPYTEELESYSPYESMGNNPVNNVDPLGDFKTWFGAFFHKIFNGGGDVGKNKFGEWFVRTTETSYSEEGGPTVTANVTYGNGRNRSPQPEKKQLATCELQQTSTYMEKTLCIKCMHLLRKQEKSPCRLVPESYCLSRF